MTDLRARIAYLNQAEHELRYALRRVQVEREVLRRELPPQLPAFTHHRAS